MSEKTIDLSLNVIHPNKDNPRPKWHFDKKNPKMAELITSIKAAGVLQPIVVRPHPTITGEYELVFGERRWRGSKMADKDKVQAFVRDYDDETTFSSLMAENIVRDDPDPILEARSVAGFLKRNKSLGDIAARFGKDLNWALRRAQIAKLSEAWQEAISEKKIDWSIEHYLRIARYTEEVQDELLKRYINHDWDVSLTSLDHVLAGMMHDVNRAPWKIDDAELVPEAGACGACPKRSSCEGHLFPELQAEKKTKAGKEPDLCTDHQCWERKANAVLEIKRIALREKHANLVEISDSHNPKGKVLGRSTIETCKKGDSGAVPAVWVDGDRIGTMSWVRPIGHGRSKRAEAAVAKATDRPLTRKEQAAQLEEKREALNKRRTLLAWRGLSDVLAAMKPAETAEAGEQDPVVILDDNQEAPPAVEDEERPTLQLPQGSIPSLQDLMVWTSMFGVGRTPHWNQDDLIKSFATLSADKKGREHALWAACFETMAETIAGCIAMRRMETQEPALIAQMIKVDLDNLISQATATIHEPKVWKTQYPDFYKNAA